MRYDIYHASAFSQDNSHQNATGITYFSMIIYIIAIFIVILLHAIAFSNAVIVQQGDKVYQCASAYGLPPQAYPVVLDPNHPAIKDYRTCDSSSYGPICPYEQTSGYGPVCQYDQTSKAPPNYLKYSHGSQFLDAFVCKQNDPKGVDLCHRYGSVSTTKLFSSLICNYISDQSELTNSKDVRVVSISCPWKKYVWITVPQE
jgi:hypothetical protein